MARDNLVITIVISLICGLLGGLVGGLLAPRLATNAQPDFGPPETQSELASGIHSVSENEIANLTNGAEEVVYTDQEKTVAVARMIVKLNPELEEIAFDEEAMTIKFRNINTQEEITVSAQDLKDGRFDPIED